MTLLVSVAFANLAGGNGDSTPLGISTNGRFALFESEAENLVPNDTNSASDIFVRDVISGITELVSVSVHGTSGNGFSRSGVMTPDGRYIAFVSAATNLVSGDTNRIVDVFVRDRLTGTTTLASVGATSTNSSTFFSLSDSPAITPDGRHVAFFSTATNLVGGARALGEVFLRDLVATTTTYVSTNAKTLLQPTLPANRTVACAPRISSDGRYIAFTAYTNTTPTLYRNGFILQHDLQTGSTTVVHTNANIPLASAAEVRNLDQTPDGRFIAFLANTNASGFTGGDATCILRWDAQTLTTTLISANLSNSVSATSMCDGPVISLDGQRVAFLSNATNLTTNALSGEYHFYVRDVTAGTAWLIDADTNNAGAGVDFSSIPSINAEANVVAFASRSASLVANDRNRAHDVFIRHQSLNTTELISRHHPDLPSETPSGGSGLAGYFTNTNATTVAFASDADDLVTDDQNGFRDAYVRDLITGSNLLVSIGTNGVAGNGHSSEPAISGDGRFVAFTSAASNLVSADLNNAQDVFIRDLLSGSTTLASRSYAPNLISLNRNSFAPALSEDGRFILFRSYASFLTPDFVGTGIENLFLRDLALETNYALTTANSGTGITAASMTPDGRFIAFAGRIGFGSTYLYVWDTQQAARIYTNTAAALSSVAISQDGQRLAYLGGQPTSLFVAELAANTNRLVSSGSFPLPTGLRFSSDGRFLVYSTSVKNSPNDTNAVQDVYLYDALAQTNILISHNFASLNSANGPSDSPSISPDGRFIAFRSSADDIVPGDHNNVPDLFFVDRLGNATILISVNQDGSTTADNRSSSPVFSADSSALVFRSWATDLRNHDYNHRGDLFLLKLRLPPMVDSDNDSLADQWELDYFTTLARTGESDFDLDGASDLHEFQAQTNPTNSVSSLRVTMAASTPPAQKPQLTWPASPSLLYRVQYKDSLHDPDWQDADTAITIFGNTGLASDLQPNANHRFYRVVIGN
jgi:Tol biopolymer transport system component